MSKYRKLPVRHIGIASPLCGIKTENHRSLRDDLGIDRYLKLGIEERFRDEIPYRICTKCINKLKNR